VVPGDGVDLGIEGITGATEIGRGGFAAVYRATQPDFHREVAVKVIILPSLDEAARNRFKRECRAIGSLSGHPNIVAVHQSGFTSTGLPYLIMDFVANGSLEDALVRDGRRPWEEAAGIGVKMARTLGFAHEHNLLHRDVKPANILISRFGEPQLADFGIASAIDTTGRSMTAMSSGTPAYAPPETWTDAAPTAAGDIYSLAATVHALITGNAPFRADSAGNVLQVIMQVAQQDPVDLRTFGVPDELSTVIHAAMAKNPAKRPGSAGAFADAMEEALATSGRAALVSGSASWLIAHRSEPTAAEVTPAEVVADPARTVEDLPVDTIAAQSPAAPAGAASSDLAPAGAAAFPLVPAEAATPAAAATPTAPAAAATPAAPAPAPAALAPAPADAATPAAPPPARAPAAAPAARRRLAALRRPGVMIPIAVVVIALIAAAVLLPSHKKHVSAGPAKLENPTALALDQSGNLYVTDLYRGLVIKVDPGGRITPFAGTLGKDGSDGGAATAATLGNAQAITFDPAGNAYIVAGGVIRKVTPAGTITTLPVHLPGASSPNSISAQAIVVDPTGNVIVATNSNIIQIDAAGSTKVLAGNSTPGFGGDGKAAVDAALNNPQGLAFGPGGVLYVADSANNRVRTINADGIIDTVAGPGGAALGDGGPAVNAAINFPTGIAFDSGGDLYIVENGGNRLRRVSASTQSIETLAGSPDGSSGFVGDGGPAKAALFNQPYGVAVTPSGNIFVSDVNNRRIRRITPDLLITTIA
jgi:sugar lactone lactonase YvrE/tRNA A-37 threonylcarbamoyl transferase component Bud32